ncbi:MAG: EamA family transporter [Prevotella sp.]|nr:EamA family transporter [Prevotella sp.]
MKWKGHLAILLANVIFGLGVPVTKALLSGWVTPMGYMASRCVFAALIFWVVAAFLPKEKVERRDLIVLLAGGLIGFVISQTLTAEALKLTTPVYFSFVAALTPIATMLLAVIFLKESITGVKLIGVVLGIAGALLMVYKSWSNKAGSDDLIGILLAVLSVLTWAVYLIITRKVSAKYTAVTQMKYFFLISAVIILPIAMTEPQQNQLYSANWGWSGVAEMAFIVLFATGLGYFLIPYAMKTLSATTVSIYTNIQPVVASFVAIAVAQDVFTWDKPLAGLLVLGGAYLVTISPEKQDSAEAGKKG